MEASKAHPPRSCHGHHIIPAARSRRHLLITLHALGGPVRGGEGREGGPGFRLCVICSRGWILGTPLREGGTRREHRDPGAARRVEHQVLQGGPHHLGPDRVTRELASPLGQMADEPGLVEDILLAQVAEGGLHDGVLHRRHPQPHRTGVKPPVLGQPVAEEIHVRPLWPGTA